uniref:Uncharacterized protein n=1 Tax=Anguilla anguilla TaxID=7936 RepID=A0A0E9XNA9_ANGAN
MCFLKMSSASLSFHRLDAPRLLIIHELFLFFVTCTMYLQCTINKV